MPTTVVPVTKAVYLCDDVAEDKPSRKVHLLGVFNAVRPPGQTPYPFRLGQLCVFAQLVGGVGEVPIHVEIVDPETEEVIYAFPEQRLRFSSRQATVSASFRIRNCSFSRPGVYVVELYCQDTFLDDRALHLLAAEEAEP
jgi:hypothetical protein